jgi:hypothetical protein
MTPPEPVTDGGTVNSVDDGYWRWVLDALSSESQSDRANAQLCYAQHAETALRRLLDERYRLIAHIRSLERRYTPSSVWIADALDQEARIRRRREQRP